MRHRFHFSRIGICLAATFFLLLGGSRLWAASTTLNYQGRVIANGVAFQGTGQFKFALISSDGSTYYWKNDASTGTTDPSSAVSLTVNRGLFSVRLGDTSIPNMMALDSATLANAGLKLRVWFNDGVKGFQQMSPDQSVSLNISSSSGVSSLYSAPGLTDSNGTLMFLTPGTWEKLSPIANGGIGNGYDPEAIYLKDSNTLYYIYTVSKSSPYPTTAKYGIGKYDLASSTFQTLAEFSFKPNTVYDTFSVFFNWGGKFTKAYIEGNKLWIYFEWSYNGGYAGDDNVVLDLESMNVTQHASGRPSLSLFSKFTPNLATSGSQTYYLVAGATPVLKQGDADHPANSSLDKHLQNANLVPSVTSGSNYCIFLYENYIYIIGSMQEWYRSPLSSLNNIFMRN